MDRVAGWLGKIPHGAGRFARHLEMSPRRMLFSIVPGLHLRVPKGDRTGEAVIVRAAPNAACILLMRRAVGVRMNRGATMVRNDGLDVVIGAEFDEMPGMRLTLPQVCRLWNLSANEADHVVRGLVGRGTLTFDHRGRVCRPADLAG
jgi:hypothetical protein